MYIVDKTTSFTVTQLQQLSQNSQA